MERLLNIIVRNYIFCQPLKKKIPGYLREPFELNEYISFIQVVFPSIWISSLVVHLFLRRMQEFLLCMKFGGPPKRGEGVLTQYLHSVCHMVRVSVLKVTEKAVLKVNFACPRF